MSEPNKVYIIDPVDPKSSVNVNSSSRDSKGELPEYLQPSSGGEQTGQGTYRSRGNEKQSGVPLILSYLAGPLSILATRRGRRSRFWAGLSLFSVTLSIVVIWMWTGLSYWSTRENPVGAVMILLAVAAVIFGFSAWTRAVVLVGRYEGPRLRRSPDWIRSSFVAGIFGIICPGMGLYVAGRSNRAAAALWMACLTVISMLVLARAAWLWNFNAYAGAFSVRPDTLEYTFIIAGATVVLGGLAWVVQALNGARLAGRAANRKTVSRRNWAAVALLVSMIAFAVLSRPAVVAEALDDGAAASRSEGMQIIPLYLSRAAVRLDPSRPAYVIRAIGLYEDNGDQVKADAMRRELIARLEPSLALLEEEGMVIPTAWMPDGMVIPASSDIDEPVEQAVVVVPAELMILDWEMIRTFP
jgi:MFS family permease